MKDCALKTMSKQNKIGKQEEFPRTRVPHAIKDGRHPGIRTISEDIGGEAVVPLTFALATNAPLKLNEAKRDNGDPVGTHYGDLMTRDRVWGLPFSQSPSVLIMDSYHDLGEDRTNTVAGMFAAQKFVERVYGEDHGVVAHLLWNWYRVLSKLVETKGPTIGKVGIENITLDTVLKDISDKKIFGALSTKNRPGQYQKNFLRDEMLRMNCYGARIQGQEDLPDKEKNELMKSLEGWIKKAESGERSLVPYESIRKKSDELVEKTRIVLSPRDKNNAFFQGLKGADVIRGINMRLYDDGYFGDMEATLVQSGLALSYAKSNVVQVKAGDGAGNIRIIGTDDPDEMQKHYTKAEIRNRRIGQVLTHLLRKEGGTPDYVNASATHAWQMQQYLYRIVQDTSRFSGEADTNYKDRRAWIGDRFVYASERLGREFLKEFGKKLENAPHHLAMEPEVADVLIPVFKRMCANLPSELRPKSPIQEMVDSLFARKTEPGRAETPAMAFRTRLGYG